MNTIRQERDNSWKPSSLASAAANKLTNFWSKKPISRQEEPSREVISERLTFSNLDITLSTITKDNVDAFRNLNLYLFPVIYNDSFYNDVLFSHPVLLSRLGKRISLW